MLKLLVLFAILQTIRGACPTGFELVKNGECRGKAPSYYILYWNTAMSTVSSKCDTYKGLPAIIHDEDHQSYWTKKVSSYYFALALVCNTATSRWEWSDGSVLDYKPQSYDKELNNSCVTGCTWYLTSAGVWSHLCTTSSANFEIGCNTQLVQPKPAGDGCENFEDDNEDGVCYQIGNTTESLEDAKVTCRSFGADVTSIHNDKENSFVRRLAVSRGAFNGVYLGATGVGNEFSWIDGSAWDYSNFYNTFPLDGYGKCLAMDTSGTSGQWVNVDCSSKLAVACMRQQNFSAPLCSPGPWKEGQIIYSPGFPDDASIPCDYLFSINTGKKIEVEHPLSDNRIAMTIPSLTWKFIFHEVLFVEANSCCDRLVLIENYIGGTVIANLTGEVSDRTYTTKSSNFMRVSWQPDGGVNVRGFMMS